MDHIDDVPDATPEEIAGLSAQQGTQSDDRTHIDDVPDATPEEIAQLSGGAQPQQATQAEIQSQVARRSKLKPETEVGTMGRKLAHGILPMEAALGGAAIGSALFPGAGTIGGFAIGAAGAVIAGGLVAKGQDMVQRALGLDDSEQMAVNAEANPISSDIGDILPQVASMRVGSLAMTGERLAQRALSGAGMGGLTAVQEGIQGEFDPKEIALAAMTGAVLPDLRKGLGTGADAVGRKIGERLNRVIRPAVKNPGAAPVEPRPLITENSNEPGRVQSGDRQTTGDDSYIKPDSQLNDTSVERPLDGIPESTRQALIGSLNGNAKPTMRMTPEEPKPTGQVTENPIDRAALRPDETTPADAQQAQASAKQVEQPVREPTEQPTAKDEEVVTPEATDNQANLAQIRAEIDRLKAENDQMKGAQPVEPRSKTKIEINGKRQPEMEAKVQELANPRVVPVREAEQVRKSLSKIEAPVDEKLQGRGTGETGETTPTVEGRKPGLEVKSVADRLKEAYAAKKAGVTEPVTKPEGTERSVTSDHSNPDVDVRAEIERLRAENDKLAAAGKAEKANMKPLKVEGDEQAALAQMAKLLKNKKTAVGMEGRRPLLKLIYEHPDISTETKKLAFEHIHKFSPEQVKTLYDDFRAGKYRKKTESGAIVKNEGEKKVKDEAASRVNAAYDRAIQKGEPQKTIPVRAEDKAALRQRVKEAYDAARAHMRFYTPNAKDRAYVWMKDARDLLSKRPMTENDQVSKAEVGRPMTEAEFWRREQATKLLEPELTHATQRINAESELNVRPETKQADEAGAGKEGEEPNEGAEGGITEFDTGAEDAEYSKSTLIKAENIKALNAVRELDLRDLHSTEGGKEYAEQLATVAHNIAYEMDKANLPGEKTLTKQGVEARELAGKTPTKPEADTESRRITYKSGAKRTEQVAKAADEGRHVEVTPELQARYGTDPEAKARADTREADIPGNVRADISAAAEKAGAPPKADEYVKPAAGEPDNNVNPIPLKELASKLLTDTAGSGKIVNAAVLDPYWRGVMKSKTVKWFTDLIGHWTTEPELKAEALLARMQSISSRLLSQIGEVLDARWYRFLNNASKEQQLKYLHAIETSKAWDKDSNMNKSLFAHELINEHGFEPEMAKWMVDEAEFHRQMMDIVWKQEKTMGSKADFIQNYVSHIFEHEAKAREFLEGKLAELRKKHGEDWFTKERSYNLIQDAIKAGHKLKYTNPIDIIGARVRASLKYQGILNTLGELRSRGYALHMEDATTEQKRTWKTQLLAVDGKTWLVDPAVASIVKNAMTSVGLRDRSDKVGSFYRAWMDVKNTFIPIKLGISAFHWVHVVLNVNLAANLAREMSNAKALTSHNMPLAHALDAGFKDAKAGDASFMQKLTYAGKALPKAFKLSAKDALYSLPDNLLWGSYKGHLGKSIRQAWQTPAEKANVEQKWMTQLFEEGGGIPHRNQQEIIRDRRRLDELAKDNKTLQALPFKAQQAIKSMTAFMFEHQIPNLKSASFMRDAEALFNRRPDLHNDKVQREAALHAIMKSVDNRYGEMFYNALFMNKVLKETAIGATLSMGWNLGQIREFGGAASNFITGKGRMAKILNEHPEWKKSNVKEEYEAYDRAEKAIGPTQKTVYDATNKGAYTAAYTAVSMASAAAVSAALSQTLPTDWKDWFFPRVGGLDPEGQPRRLTTPFNTREPFMLKAHMDSEGPIGGLAAFAWNKMILSPLTDLIHNHDYYGNEMFDENAPWYKKSLQAIDSFMGDQFTPIGKQGYDRSIEQGGGSIKSLISTFMGFGPAPAYVNRSPMQRRLTQLYNDHVKPTSRPYEDRGPVHALINWYEKAEPSKQTKIREAITSYNQANTQGDKPAMAKAQTSMIAAGMSKDTALHMAPGDADKRKFARLPLSDQKALVSDMDDAEYRKYVTLNLKVHRGNRIELMRLRKGNKPAVPLPAGNAEDDE